MRSLRGSSVVKLNIVCVGKLKERYLREAADEYLKRLSRFCKTEIKELPELASPKEEAEEILRALKGRIIALALEGKSCSSEQFAKGLKSCIDRGEEVTFVIGSSCGLDSRVKERADGLLSFSQMTFPHQLMRVILLEQIYRAFMINAGAEYHK